MTIRQPVVVVGSSNGSRNYGDDMMWLATSRAVRDLAPEVPIVTDSANGWLPPVGGVETLPFMHDALLRYRMVVTKNRWLNRAQGAAGLMANRGALDRGLRRQEELVEGAPTTGIEKAWEDAISNSQALIFSGAGGLTDTFALHAVAGWGMMVALAHRHNVPTIMLGQGVGPLNSPTLRASLGRTLGRCEGVTTRDERSTDLVRQLCPEIPVKTTIDWAVMEAPSATTRDHVDAYLRSNGAEDFVAVSLHDWRPADNNSRTQAARLMETVCRVAKAQGLRVALVPNMVGLRRADDRIFMRSAVEMMPANLRDQVIDLPGNMTAFETRSVLARSKGVFASRYHPVVFALASGTPATGICYDDYYAQKHEGALGWYAETDRIHRVGQDHDDSWWARGIELTRDGADARLMTTESLREDCMRPLRSFIETAGVR